jgi:uncharacterized protein
MRIVLDANVLVAAFAARGLCESLFELCLGSHEILLSEQLLHEVTRSLSKKVKLDRRIIAEIERLLRENGTLLTSVAIPSKACRDNNDLHVLRLAQSGRADYIITGDDDLLILKRFGPCKIVNPRKFWMILQAK